LRGKFEAEERDEKEKEGKGWKGRDPHPTSRNKLLVTALAEGADAGVALPGLARSSQFGTKMH